MTTGKQFFKVNKTLFSKPNVGNVKKQSSLILETVYAVSNK